MNFLWRTIGPLYITACILMSMLSFWGFLESMDDNFWVPLMMLACYAGYAALAFASLSDVKETT